MKECDIMEKCNINEKCTGFENMENKNSILQKIPMALTIAGSDSSGGAGIQADLKTMTVHGVYGMSVITAITAQNTTGVFGIEDIDAKMVEMQMDAVFSDIFPGAVKIGMVSNAQIIESIVKKLRQWNAQNIVVDTVMVSTSGHDLIDQSAMEALKSKLLPIADIITPNILEAQKLANMEIKCKDDMIKAANMIRQYTDASILIKGGHLEETADDLLCCKSENIWFNKERINNSNTHGTGCTLSSSICSNLAKGMDIIDAVRCAKEYVYGAIKDGMDIGKGNGPLNHMYQYV